MRIFDDLVKLSGTSFFIFRAGRKLSEVKGLYNDELAVDLPFNCGIQVGDTIVNEVTGEKFVVVKLKKELTVAGDAIDFITAKGAIPASSSFGNITYNVNNAYGSAFGTNASSVYQSASIDDLRKIIAENTIDTDKFNELLIALEHCSENGNYEKSSLAKFAKLLQENAWLMGPLATHILKNLFG